MENQTRVHIAINVRDMKKGSAFYTHLFGCTPNRIANDQLDWILNEPPIHLSIYSNEKSEYGLEHIGFDMPKTNLDEFKTRIGVNDVKLHDPDKIKIELYTSEFNKA